MKQSNSRYNIPTNTILCVLYAATLLSLWFSGVVPTIPASQHQPVFPNTVNPGSSHFGLPESDPASVSMTGVARPPSVPFWESLSKEGNSLGYHMAFLSEGQKHHPT